ncbi:MAG: hypothetical protein ACK4NQ_11335 [Fimbriimonadaceae bacterium]
MRGGRRAQALGLILVLSACSWSQGVVRHDLTPPEPLPLGGYTERGPHTFEPSPARLYTRAVALRTTGRPVVLVSLEMLTIPEGLRDAVRQRVGDQTEVVLMATHTHCAPDSQMLNPRMTFPIPGIATFRSRWLEWYADQIAEAVRVARRQPLSLDDLTFARESQPFQRARRPGVTESESLALFAGSQPWLVAVPAHATVLPASHRTLSGDWPGAVAQNTGALVVPGAIGDASPATRPGESVYGFARRISRWVQAAPRRTLTTNSAKVVVAPVNLPAAVPHPEFVSSNGVTPELAQLVMTRFAPPTAELTLIQLGELLLIGVPGEPTGAFARQLRATAWQQGFRNSYVLSHTNGWAGYLLTSQEYEQGGYEATLSFYGADVLLEFEAGLSAGCERLRSMAVR